MQGNYRIGKSNIGKALAGAMGSKNKATRAPIIKENQRKEREATEAKHKQEYAERRANSLSDAKTRYKMQEHEKRKTIKYKAKQDVKKYEGKARVALDYKQKVSTMKAANRSAQLKGKTNAPKNDLEVKKKRTVETPKRKVPTGNKI